MKKWQKLSLTLLILLTLLFVFLCFFSGLTGDGKRLAQTENKEKYIFVGMMWNHPVWQQARAGGLQAAEFWNSRGGDITIEFSGPDEADLDGVHAALKAAVSENPTGIIYLDLSTGYEEETGAILSEYHDNGGMISSLVGVGSADEWPVDHIGGIDNVSFGRDMAEWAVSLRGSDIKVGLMTVSENFQHKQRVEGILDYFGAYSGVEIVKPYMEETHTPEGAVANALDFLSRYPDVDVLLGTTAQSAGALGRAVKALGYKPGELLIIGADQDPDMVSMVREGYVEGALGYSFAADIFSSVSWMHIQNQRAVSFTKFDEEYNLWVIPERSIIPSIRLTEENIHMVVDLPIE